LRRHRCGELPAHEKALLDPLFTRDKVHLALIRHQKSSGGQFFPGKCPKKTPGNPCEE
jgi:hypothetical protein